MITLVSNQTATPAKKVLRWFNHLEGKRGWLLPTQHRKVFRMLNQLKGKEGFELFIPPTSLICWSLLSINQNILTYQHRKFFRKICLLRKIVCRYGMLTVDGSIEVLYIYILEELYPASITRARNIFVVICRHSCLYKELK